MSLFRRFVSYYRKYRWWFILDMAVALLSSALSIAAPAIVRHILNVSLPVKAYGAIALCALIMFVIYALQSIFTFIRIKWGHYLGVWIENDMRQDLFDHLQTLSFSYFDRTKTGTIMSRISNDLFNVAEFAHHGPEDVLISIATLLGAYVLMFSFSYRLALVSIIPLPLMLIYGIVFNKRLKKTNRAIRARIADVNVAAENSIQGIREVKSYSQEDFQKKKFSSSNYDLRESREAMYKEMAKYHAGIDFMREFYYFMTIIGGIVLIARGEVTYSDLVTFILYVSVVLPPIDRLIAFTEQFTQGAASFERFTEVMDIKPEIEDKKDAKPLIVTNGDIEYKDVSFSYESNGEKVVINGMNLSIPGGMRVAIVGESGAGKSTAVQLLARFYEKNGGSITIDGVDIDNVTQKSLHEAIGFVQQNVFLFDASIKENLRYGNSDATEEEMWKALENARLSDFVRSLPDGLDTEVGERGTRLSGGQKQRLSIARIFLKNPRVLIFDEATSSLDTESEMLIQDALNKLAVGRTCIVIAHRLSTIIDSDIIYVMDKGKVVEKGSHEELLEKHGLYYKLYSIKR